MRNVLRTFAAAVLLGMAFIAGCPKQPVSNQHPTTTPTSTTAPASAFLTAQDVEKLKPQAAKEPRNTGLAPNLQQPIVAGKNSLWCASFQLAWNELMDFSGGPIILKDAPPAADALNQQIITRAEMDPTSVVAVAGTVESGAIEAGGMPTRSFIFDHPFLVLLIQKGAKQPYFALWIGNAELLVRSAR